MYLNPFDIVYIDMILDLTTVPAFTSRQHVGDYSILSFNVSNTYEMPVELLTSHILQFENVLTFASKLIEREKSITDEFTRESMFAEYLKDVKELHSEELVQAEKKSLSELLPTLQKVSDIERLKNEQIEDIRREYEQQIKNLQKANKSLEHEVQTVKSELEITLQKELRIQQKRIVELESDLLRASRGELSIREQCKAESDKLIKAIEDNTNKFIKAKEESINLRELRLKEKELELDTKAQRINKSVSRGQDGENFFMNLTKEKMNWDLKKAPTHSCDYSSTILAIQALFEVKNYTTVVPQKEITKFLSDMKSHPEALVGVFISLNSGIVGKSSSDPITIDWINSSQCVIYVQSALEFDIDNVLSIIEQIIRVVGIFNTALISNESKSQEPILQQRIEQAKGYLERMIARLTKLITKIGVDKKQYITLIEANTQYSISELKYQIIDLTTSIQILLGTDDSPTETTSEESEPLPQPVKPKRPVAKKKESISTALF